MMKIYNCMSQHFDKMSKCKCVNYFLSICNTPVLTLFALNVYDVYIVINRGVELKAKSPPSIWLFYFSVIEVVLNGIL